MMILAFDPGFGNVKLVGAAGRYILQSAVATDGGTVTGRMTGLRRVRPPLRIEFDGGAFYVGTGAHDWGRPVESLDFDRLTGAPEMRALFYAALSLHEWPAEPVALMVGLPIAALTGPEAVATKRAVSRWLRGEHCWRFLDGDTTRDLAVTVASVRLTSQPVGALFDWLLDDDGQWIPKRRCMFRKEIGILGVGMNTVDLLVVRNGRPVQRFIAGENRGVRRLLQLCNGSRLYSLAELDSRLRAGALDIGAALPVWAREVTGLVESQWEQHYRRFAAVIVVGGGAAGQLLRNQLLRRFSGRAWVPDDPVIATARGLYKYALMKQR